MDMAVGYFPAVVAAIGLQTMQSGTPDNFRMPCSTAVSTFVMRRGHPLVRDLNASPLTLDASLRSASSAGQFFRAPVWLYRRGAGSD